MCAPLCLPHVLTCLAPPYPLILRVRNKRMDDSLRKVAGHAPYLNAPIPWGYNFPFCLQGVAGDIFQNTDVQQLNSVLLDVLEINHQEW